MHYAIRKCNIENCFMYLFVRMIVLLSCIATADSALIIAKSLILWLDLQRKPSQYKAIHDYAD